MVKLSYYNNLGISDFSRIGLVWNLFANFGKQEPLEIVMQSRAGAVVMTSQINLLPKHQLVV